MGGCLLSSALVKVVVIVDQTRRFSSCFQLNLKHRQTQFPFALLVPLLLVYFKDRIHPAGYLGLLV